ncbi:MAG: permease [Chloroflexota bacterium]
MGDGHAVSGAEGDKLIAPQFEDWISVFLGILVEATPFLLLGVIVSALVQIFVSEDMLLRYVPKNPILSIVPALGIGMLMPVCECGNVAVARRFLAKGVPVSSCIAFLLAAPVLNPVALIATATAFRYQPSMVWMRGGLTFLVAATAGLLIGQWGKGEELLASGLIHGHTHSHEHAIPIGRWGALGSKVEQAVNHAGTEFMSMMQVLLFGASIASASQVLLPRSAITGIGSGIVLGIIAMMSLAFVLSICSTVDSFFALSYSNIFPTPALLAFLVFGPMMSMKGIALMLTAFRPRVVFALAAITVELVFVAALLVNLKGVLL